MSIDLHQHSQRHVERVFADVDQGLRPARYWCRAPRFNTGYRHDVLVLWHRTDKAAVDGFAGFVRIKDYQGVADAV